MRPNDWIYDGGHGLNEADSRLSEAHHRIANNLTLIAGFVRLQASGLAREQRTLAPAEGRLLLHEIGARIETIGRLHRLLSANPGDTRVDLGDYICATCRALADTVSFDQPVELICDAQPCMADSEQAQLLGLILTELVTNAVKYAHPAGAPGRIAVRCRPLDDVILATVSDDGVGLPEGFDPLTDGGLGMRVIRSLARQLGAELEFVSHGLGLTIHVTVPRQATSDLADPRLPHSFERDARQA